MSSHQIIYTSCMRGINGVNDGQQIYSYDASFKDADNDEIKSLFSYQLPSLEKDEVMTEEIALKMPKSFIYRRLENGSCALALNTYLGRDYMGSAGRFGNHLSHVVVADESDIKNYPCEFYGGNLLRNHMEYEEVNNPNRPDFLPEPILERGFTVDIDTIIEFLNIDDRMEIFKNMLYAVLAFETERKRVVICDQPENVIMWIAAIEYTLPLKSALRINFSTYDFNPSLSASQICGVIPQGTGYNYESQRLHLVFDFYQNHYEEFEKDERYFDFIDTSISFSYDSLQDFHRFISEGYTYDKADENMYAAYRLYSLLSDGIFGLTQKELISALNFANEYSLPGEQSRILENIFEQRDSLSKIDSESFLIIMRYIISKYDALTDNNRSVVKEIMIERVLREYLNDIDEELFRSFYSEVDSLCRQKGFSVATELMKPSNREKLFSVMQNDINDWKIVFIVKVVSTFVKDQHVSVNELSIASSLGKTYYGLIQAIYSKNAQNGFYLVTKILDEFATDCKYLVNMALNIENMLINLPNGYQEVASMWKYFGQTMVKYQQSDFETAYIILGDRKKYEQIYMLYSLAMSNASGLTQSQYIFSEHYDTFIVRNYEYAQLYRDRIFNNYFSILESYDDETSYSAKIKLFDIISISKTDVPFAERLVNELIKFIPFESPSKENEILIKNSYYYLNKNLHRPIKGKLLLLVIAMILEKCDDLNQLHCAFGNIERLTENRKADMLMIKSSYAENYFEWLLPNVCDLCERAIDIDNLYNLFDMSGEVSNLFFTMCAKIYLKQSKGDKDYGVFCEFLGVVFNRCDAKNRKEIGKVLCKLNKQKLSDLDESVRYIYHKDRMAIHYWEEIKGVAETTNPILNNFSNFFKKKKDQ